MRSLSLSQLESIISLRNQGLAYKKIARELKISVGSVHSHSKNLILSPEKIEILKQNEKRNQEQFVKSHEKEIQIPKLNKDFANLLGHLFFDGTVFYCNGKSTLGFANASYVAVASFFEKNRGLFWSGSSTHPPRQ